VGTGGEEGRAGLTEDGAKGEGEDGLAPVTDKESERHEQGGNEQAVDARHLDVRLGHCAVGRSGSECGSSGSRCSAHFLGQPGIDLPHRPHNLFAEGPCKAVIEHQRPEEGIGEAQQGKRVADEGGYVAKQHDDEVVRAVVVDVALDAGAPLALVLWRCELGEEL